MNLTTSQLTDDKMLEIINKLSQTNPTQYNYFLKLSLFENNCHPVKPYKERYDVLFGEVREIVARSREDQCNSISDIYLLPLTDKVVIHYYGRGGEPQDEFDELYVFTFDKGWQSVDM